MSDTQPVFNIVVTGQVFWHLRFFVCSLVHNSDARFRFVANACAPETLTLLEEYAAAHPGRVVEILDVSSEVMVAHGVALDSVRRRRHDGELFCLVDPDIKARTTFLPSYLELLGTHSAVTSGRQVWVDDHVVPDTHLGFGLDGRHFFHPNGFVYGCPHFAMYRRAHLDETCARWGVGLGSAGPELSDAARSALASAGHLYQAYDTGKIVNILLQVDGRTLRHIDPDELIHVGGMSQFLSPDGAGAKGGEVETPRWAAFHGMEPRLVVTRFTAALLRSLIEETPPPDLPRCLDGAMAQRLVWVRDEIVDLVERYRTCAARPVEAGS
jgi:hypothetical protein